MIKNLIFLSLLFYSTLCYSNILETDSTQNFYIEIAKGRCASSKEDETHIIGKDFKWYLHIDELIKLSRGLYHSNKRLFDRAYYDDRQKSFILPVRESLSTTHNITLSENFINNLTAHIETALGQRYAEEINFSDMGHSHFLIPKDYYDKKIRTSIKDRALVYKTILDFKDTLFVYHTAEQLDMKVEKINEEYHLPKNDYLKHRYLTRNLIGYNNNSNKLDVVQVEDLKKEYNTVGSKHNNKYKWFTAGYYMHASHQGCFPFKKFGTVYYFDISLEGPHSIYTNDSEGS